MTWYSMAFAVVLYVTTFLLGVLFGSAIQYKIDQAFSKQTADLPTPIEEVVHISESHYVNKDFGIEFDLHSVGGPVQVIDRKLTGALSGSITRFDLPQNVSAEDFVQQHIDSEGKVVEHCFLEHLDTAQGQKTIRIRSHKELEYYTEAEAQQRLYQPEPDFEMYSIARGYALNDCGSFVTAIDYGGYFLYDPIIAPKRIYYIEDGYFGGEASFYNPNTFRVLPD